MNKEDFQALLDKYLRGIASPAETKLLDQFFDSYRNNEGSLQDLSEGIKGEILHGIHTSIAERKRNLRPAFAVWIRAAAVVSILISGTFLYTTFEKGGDDTTRQLAVKTKELHTSKGQKLDLKLSDGSRIRLNSNTTISYPEKFTPESREVTVDGEAYFEVAHDSNRPFVVHTSYVRTRVLGTSFNVLSGPEATAITLVDGKVTVSTQNGDTATLSPNFQATITRGLQNIDKREVDVSRFVGWKDNTLHFNNVTVKEAFTIIENWYNVQIDVQDQHLLNCMITSKYQNESLENVLNSFRFILKIDYTINGQHVTVTGKGC